MLRRGVYSGFHLIVKLQLNITFWLNLQFSLLYLPVNSSAPMA